MGITVIILHKFGFKFYDPNNLEYVEKIRDGHNNLKFEWYNRISILSKYVHNQMKEKLDGVSKTIRLIKSQQMSSIDSSTQS